ncbi:acyl carrier protein [Methylosinus sp. Sm6]|uniref:acyl carrier protein n=1 Tax=Methylosinus sp. Sm6 TaxID=2866948 RepID=UPI001C994E71|nr:acyl carrier protein [Methylosinus sp. Sm6]MBY6244089.1 acyl carrier protein [Methylosinus sp. Sm6]
MIETIRRAIEDKGRLSVASLALDADLYAAGLSPFAAIQVMLELERRLAVEFPKPMLNRRSMASIGAIAALLERLQADAGRLQAA